VLVPRRDLLLVGITERTNKAGVQALIRSLKKADAGVKTVIIVEIPGASAPSCISTRSSPFINRHECLVYPPGDPAEGGQAAKVTSVDLTTKRGASYHAGKVAAGALKKQGFDLDPIYCGGQSAVDQQREQWTDGANAFALAPGIILLYERNVRTAEELRGHGYHIVYED
jgi:arginine deiminase